MTPSTMPPGDGSSLTEPLMGDSDEEAAGDRENGLLASTATSIEPPASKWMFLHATYHCIVTILGTGILGFPHATAAFGYVAAVIFITFITLFSFYTTRILVNIQEIGQTSYSDIADGLFGPGWAKYRVRPFLFVTFFPTVAVMILIGGDALYTLIHLGRDLEVLPAKICGVIMGAVVFVISLLPDLSEAWPVSVVGSVAAFLIVSYALAGSSLWIERCDRSENDYHDGGTIGIDPVFNIMSAAGSFLFGYGFHSIVPDITSSLHIHEKQERVRQMMTAVKLSFSFVGSSYIVIACLGYAAFGMSVSSNVMDSIGNVMGDGPMYVIWAFIAVKTATEAAAYNQASFALLRESFGLANRSNEDHLPAANAGAWAIEMATRLTWTLSATILALFIPYFSDLTAITSAIGFTPLSFVLPMMFWNKKNEKNAPRWRVRMHYAFMVVFILLALMALIGAIGDLTVQMSGQGSSAEVEMQCVAK